MQINKFTDYGLRAIAFMATQPRGKVCVVKQISQATDIPESYLIKVLKSMEKAGLTRSHRGSHGGYSLTRNPQEGTFLDLVQALGGPVGLSFCRVDQEESPQKRKCSIHSVWRNVQEKMKEEMARYSLAD